MIEKVAPKGERVAKWMARAGLCSRREAERWIADGRVKVDGKTIDTPGITVLEPQQIEVDGKQLSTPEAPRIWRYHKPPGLVTTHKDEKGRATVFDKMPDHLPRVISVGRLDLNTEGLLLMTNDGGLARQLELPKTGWKRRYRVRVYGSVEPSRLEKLKDGITIDGVRYSSIEAKMEKRTTANAWLQITLTEGKNREIRRVLEHLGFKVNRLIRTDYGPFKLGDLTRGAVKEVSRRHMREHLYQLETGEDGAPKKRSTKGWAKAKKKPAKRKAGTLDKKTPKRTGKKTAKKPARKAPRRK